MTPQEQSAYAAGIEPMRQAALKVSVTIEVRDVRQQAAIAQMAGSDALSPPIGLCAAIRFVDTQSVPGHHSLFSHRASEDPASGFVPFPARFARVGVGSFRHPMSPMECSRRQPASHDALADVACGLFRFSEP